MPNYNADGFFKIDGPSRRGWFQLTLFPRGLDQPALVIVAGAGQERTEPIARIVVGPAYPVLKAVYFPAAELDLEIHVFSRGGEVQAQLGQIQPAQLARALGARLRDLRHLSLRSIAARGMGVLQRMRERTQPVGMLQVDPISSLEVWLTKYGRVSEEASRSLQTICERHSPVIRVILLDTRRAGGSNIEYSLSAIRRQTGPHLDVVTLGANGELSLESASKLRSCGTLFWVEAGEEPAEHAFLALEAAICREDGIAFADWIDVDRGGAGQSVLCAGWDPVRAAVGFELRGVIALRGRPLRELVEVLIGPSRGLRPTRRTMINSLAGTVPEVEIVHVPAPLTRAPPVLAPVACLRSCACTTTGPLASIIVPTHARAELLSRCVSTCFDQTIYRPVELIVVDHASNRPEMTEALDAIGKRRGAIVLREEGPFNFSRLINTGVGRSTGEIIVMLNDDVEAIDHEWLAKLIRTLEHPRIGIVGPRLLYPDGRIQHNGVALGMGGLAGHPGRGCQPHSRNLNRADPWPRTVSAVTGACLITRRRDFDAVGGMDENLAVEFNDVDLCLRIAARGLRCVVDPRISLVHHEQATRAGRNPDVTVAQSRDRAYFVNRWGAILADDPWFSPNLTLDDDSCGLADPPRAPRNLAPRRRDLMPQPSLSRPR
jgi:GT2 family glycosyltransferase